MLPQSPFVALQHRNFRLLWTGLLISFSGSNMQTAALLWHVSLLVPPDKRPIALGMVGLVRLMPIIFFSIAGGTLADASDRRRVMLITQTGMALTALALAVLTFRGLSHPWPLYALAAIGASFGAFDAPARQSLTPTLVPRDHLPNAISLHAIAVQLSSVVGPTIGGLIIATLGIEWVYALNALTFVCVIAALLMMRDLPARSATDTGDISVRAVSEGFRLRLFLADYPVDDAAGFLCDVLFVGDCAAADLRAGRSARRRQRIWMAVRGPVGRRGADQHRHGAVDRDGSSGAGVVLLWAVGAYGAATIVFGLSQLVPAHVSLPCRHRGGRYRQHGAPQCDSSAWYARSPARPNDRHQHGVLPGRARSSASSRPASSLNGSARADRSSPEASGCLIAAGWIAARTPALRKYRRSFIDASERGRLRSMVR